jgi:triacylglycerol esterase/lipase EstA (alpha/beta hydrolase family)
MKQVFTTILPLLAAALLCQCGAPQPPRCTSVPRASRVPAVTLIGNAHAAWKILANPARSKDWEMAQDEYNSSIAKLFDQLRCGTGTWNSRAATIGTSIATPDARHVDLEKLDVLFPAAQVGTGSVGIRRTTAGIGIPLVGWKKTTPVGTPRPAFYLPTGLPYLVTATLDFERTGVPVWHFVKRWLHDDTTIGKRRQGLAADWTAPNAFYWKMSNLDELKIQNVLLPERFTKETGLYFLQPYDPAKIPVVLIHGLVSCPDAFKTLINDLAPEPWFRQNYQIWLYNYPTGNPWIYSSMQFRKLMREACAYARTKGDTRKLHQMVIIGHSMGGLIARSSVTNPNTAFYNAYFKQPLHQLKVSGENRRNICDATLYQPLTEPRRVAFLAVPHRGSPAANMWLSILVSKLIKLPKQLSVDFLDSAVQTVGRVLDGSAQQPHMTTSINSLSPTDKATLTLGQLPLPSGIIFHSIIGDRGKGNTPDSSDGVVPYWSSHVAAASEKIVPSNHSVPNCQATSEELKRILKLHLQTNSAMPPTQRSLVRLGQRSGSP